MYRRFAFKMESNTQQRTESKIRSAWSYAYYLHTSRTPRDSKPCGASNKNTRTREVLEVVSGVKKRQRS